MLFCTVRHQAFRYSTGTLLGGPLVASGVLPAHAASATSFNFSNLSAPSFLLEVLLTLAIAVGAVMLLISVGHYAVKYNRTGAKRVFYALGTALIASAVSRDRLPATATTVLALGEGALVYCAWPRFKQQK